VVLDRLTKSFAKQRGWRAILTGRKSEPVRALSEVSCEVRSGEFFGLLGENGAGKTTLFKILATLVIPESGTASVSGFDVMRSPNRVREVLAPVIADERSLNWRLSARENMRLFAALHGLRGAAATRRIDELLALVNLVEATDRLVSGFSSGMKQRLLVARTLLARPSVLLLDEPTRSLDPTAAHAFRSFLREELAARRRCAVLIATHRAEEAFELCDRVVVMHRGRVAAEGRASTLGESLLGSRYGVWTLEPNHRGLSDLVAAGRAKRVAARSEGDGRWWRVDLEIDGGDDAAQELLRSLVSAGVPVARFERVLAPLGELIERAIGRSIRR
jgi:ABC-2 type transport system ATP-binding protein